MKVEPFELPELTGPRLHLRAWRASDVPAVQEASKDHYIPTITTVPTTIHPGEALAFVERQSARIRDRSAYVFAIADDSDSAVGHIGLFPLSTAGARASIGYWVLPSQRRRGYAAEALEILTAWARELDALDRLELYVEPWNTGSWRAAESAGYEREGLLRSWERIGGEPRDMFMYARLTTARQSAGSPLR
ncbi:MULTISPECIES: GNAT family N-acetyltransferase [unclassified Rathayibacter]|jgi:RimJ/RimL family protein N-acetyltransferase|uniref:GNAT family N-acetyltransferase n=1 Tax=unclassified Rathayibacter TaxID=2609250 RepID=UPI000CE901EC|nr:MULTISPECIES: GNAT family protein [unclassified Rathayibacter]PPF23787.1 N-acetyltransferase [Rathayibacter sp. AY1F2]PPH40881.1 N-acetyltransferase [Rathayibacter sp. AY1F7]